MSMAPLEQVNDSPEEEDSISLNYTENPDVKKLLDTIISILAKEYIQKAKENPDIFSK